jgi:predicted acetyltransferase
VNITVESISRDEKEILRNLTELYEYEFSKEQDSDVNDFGLYGYKEIDHYWTDENKYPYFIKVNDKLAGFVLIDDYRYIKTIDAQYCIAEFFVMNKYKKLGVGKYAIKIVLDKYKGKWQLGYQSKNEGGKRFWNKVINEYTNGNYELFKENVDQIHKDGTMAEVLIFET